MIGNDSLIQFPRVFVASEGLSAEKRNHLMRWKSWPIAAEAEPGQRIAMSLSYLASLMRQLHLKRPSIFVRNENEINDNNGFFAYDCVWTIDQMMKM